MVTSTFIKTNALPLYQTAVVIDVKLDECVVDIQVIMSIQVDNAELMSLLESSDVHTSSQVRELIQEQLNTG